MSADMEPLTINGRDYDPAPTECPECGETVDAQVVLYFGQCSNEQCRATVDQFEADALSEADV